MSAPEVGPVTAQVYADLPELYRNADVTAGADAGSDYPLLRYLSLLLDQLTIVHTLIGRFLYEPLDDRTPAGTDSLAGVGLPWQRYGSGTYGESVYGDVETSDLVDPVTADAGWLPWLGSLVGVDVTGMSVTEQRAAIASPELAWAHGTPGAIAALVRSRLSGFGYVDVVPHYEGDPFLIGIVTKRDETATSTTWGELETIAPTWGALVALGSWNNLEAADALNAAAAELPAGFAYRHRYLEDVLED